MPADAAVAGLRSEPARSMQGREAAGGRDAHVPQLSEPPLPGLPPASLSVGPSWPPVSQPRQASERVPVASDAFAPFDEMAPLSNEAVTSALDTLHRQWDAPGALAAIVNQALMEQARLHGVDLT
jgi:hypothetical protein